MKFLWVPARNDVSITLANFPKSHLSHKDTIVDKFTGDYTTWFNGIVTTRSDSEFLRKRMSWICPKCRLFRWFWPLERVPAFVMYYCTGVVICITQEFTVFLPLSPHSKTFISTIPMAFDRSSHASEKPQIPGLSHDFPLCDAERPKIHTHCRYLAASTTGISQSVHQQKHHWLVVWTPLKNISQ